MNETITWHGHSNFHIAWEGGSLVIDPFFTDNPKAVVTVGEAPKPDYVLLTHMHGDHIGGLLGKHGEAVFSRALVYVSMPEWEFWQNGTAGPQGKQVRKVLHAYGSRVRTFRFGEEVLPGIKALDASGHTPGHTVFETDSLLIVGDLLHAAALQIPRPEVCTIYDMNPSGAVQARRRFYEFAASSPKPVAGMHLPYPGIGRIGRSAAGYVYLPGK